VLASGWDVTRALVTTSLEQKDLVDDVSDLAESNLAPKLKQLLAFFLNKCVAACAERSSSAA